MQIKKILKMRKKLKS